MGITMGVWGSFFGMKYTLSGDIPYEVLELDLLVLSYYIFVYVFGSPSRPPALSNPRKKRHRLFGFNSAVLHPKS